MTVIAIVPILVLVVGLILMFIKSSPTVNRVGEIMFLCGLMAVCFHYSGTPITLGK